MAQFLSDKKSKPDKKDDAASEDESKKKAEHAPDSEYWFYAGILAQASVSDSVNDAASEVGHQYA